MTRRRICALAGLALLAAAAALAVLPARWIMAALPDTWPLAVADAHGTIWSGSATLALGTPERRRTLAEPLRWRTSLAGGPRLAVTHPWLGGPLILTPAWLGLKLSAQTLHVPATALTALDARLEALGPDGELSLRWPATIFGARAAPPPGTPALDVQWRDAASALTSIRPLGDYTLALVHGAGGRIDLTLGTRQGPLMLEGKGTLDRQHGLQFDGTAQADPAAGVQTQAALRDVLAALGPSRQDKTLLRLR